MSMLGKKGVLGIQINCGRVVFLYVLSYKPGVDLSLVQLLALLEIQELICKLEVVGSGGERVIFAVYDVAASVRYMYAG